MNPFRFFRTNLQNMFLCIGEEITDLMLENNETKGKCEDCIHVEINFSKKGTKNRKIISRVNKIREIAKDFSGIFWST